MKILQKLKKHFEDNTEEQILKEWEETKNDNCVNAPTVEQFLLYGVVVSEAELLCNVMEGHKCKDPFPNYSTGVCRNCGGQSN
tara:strand:- start:1838 stop:2086 length:249 start_codon:yes stop_codon:yes gene_type:complete